MVECQAHYWEAVTGQSVSIHGEAKYIPALRGKNVNDSVTISNTPQLTTKEGSPLPQPLPLLRPSPQLLLFSGQVLPGSLQPHGLRHARLPCLSLSPGACSNSCPLSQWFHPTISSSVVPFSSCPQSFPASGSFPASQFFASCGLSIGASASASVLPINIQSWFPLGLIGLISLLSRDPQESSPTP